MIESIRIKNVEKEKIELEKKFNLGNSQLTENQNKNKKLEKQISDQEEELKKLKEKLETMKYEFEIKEKNELMKLEQSKKENEIIKKNEKLESNITIILKKLSKLKIIIQEFKRNINMEVILQTNPIEEGDDNNHYINIWKAKI